MKNRFYRIDQGTDSSFTVVSGINIEVGTRRVTGDLRLSKRRRTRTEETNLHITRRVLIEYLLIKDFERLG